MCGAGRSFATDRRSSAARRRSCAAPGRSFAAQDRSFPPGRDRLPRGSDRSSLRSDHLRRGIDHPLRRGDRLRQRGDRLPRAIDRYRTRTRPNLGPHHAAAGLLIRTPNTRPSLNPANPPHRSPPARRHSAPHHDRRTPVPGRTKTSSRAPRAR